MCLFNDIMGLFDKQTRHLAEVLKGSLPYLQPSPLFNLHPFGKVPTPKPSSSKGSGTMVEEVLGTYMYFLFCGWDLKVASVNSLAAVEANFLAVATEDVLVADDPPARRTLQR